MSSPQQPWSPGQPSPSSPPGPQGYPPAPGYGAPQGYGPPPGYGIAPTQQSQPGQRPPAFGGPTGELVINLDKPFGAMGLITPVVTIDGFPATATWGRNAFPAPAGVRQVDVSSSYLWTYGRATIAVPVQAGSSSEIFYSGPMWTLGMPGAIGTEPQKRPGKGLFIGLLAFIFGVLLLSIILAVVSSM